MQLLLRRFALALAVIFALTFLLVGTTLVAARMEQTLHADAPLTVRWSDGALLLEG